jgi:hypothetical protein
MDSEDGTVFVKACAVARSRRRLAMFLKHKLTAGLFTESRLLRSYTRKEPRKRFATTATTQ